ncbi:MAG: universal stress protein [Myxococcales bacterium]|nr:universal stress protein [Myxococcales bacterium]
MPKRFLIACDALEKEEPIPPSVASMARHFDAEVVLVNVAPQVPRSWLFREVLREEAQTSLMATRKQQLERLARKMRGVPTRTLVRQGVPHVEIVCAAIEERCDLVVVIDDPRLRDRGSSFGMTTMRLMRKCPLPVWAVRRDSRRPRRVMAAVDVPLDGKDDDGLNHRVLQLALTFTPPSAAPLTVMHAWSLWGEHMLAAPGRMRPDELAEALADTEREHKRALEAVVEAESVDLGSVRLELVKGDATFVVPRVVARKKIDLLVMGTVARTGLPSLLMGNTAERILNQVTCSVIAVKPPHFVSPIASA